MKGEVGKGLIVKQGVDLRMGEGDGGKRRYEEEDE